MPSTVVADRFEQHLNENWTATPVIPYDTIAEAPDVPAFVVQQYPVVLGIKPYLERRFFEEGTYRLVLNVRRGIGLRQGTLWEDELKALFRNIQFDDVDLETFTPDGSIIDDNSEEGDWIVYSIIVPYRYQYEAGVPVIVEAAGSAGGVG